MHKICQSKVKKNVCVNGIIMKLISIKSVQSVKYKKNDTQTKLIMVCPHSSEDEVSKDNVGTARSMHQEIALAFIADPGKSKLKP